MDLDPTRCRRIVESRDTRYDGTFIHAVTSTGIYCRPSCPARTPAARNSRFFPTGAAAQLAGFRACKRCRPDAVPGSAEWNTRADVAARAMRLIADGVVDREGVGGLARRLAYSERQLQRLLMAELGAPALTLARAQRAHVARLLVETTTTSLTDVAFAAGFASVRQFNDTFREIYDATPTELRRAASSRPGAGPPAATGPVRLRLPFRAPFDAPSLLGFLAARAIDGVERADTETYSRTLTLPSGSGHVDLVPRRDHVECVLELDDLSDLSSAVSRCRRLLDLDADPTAVAERLGPLVAGLRLPGSVDPFEIAVRAVVGQQVSVAGARRTLSKMADAHGRRDCDRRGDRRWFPTPQALAAADPATFEMPARRAAAVSALAVAVAAGELVVDAGADRDEVRQGLLAIPGIGPWTADYVVMRAMSDPDVFLATDLIVRRRLDERGLTPTDVQAWRPWRSYAVIALWADDGLSATGSSTGTSTQGATRC